MVEITIEDNGVGISDENMVKLFKIGENFTTSGTSNEEGTGLGLILCKEFMENSGGSLEIKSKVGKGTKFTLKVPPLNQAKKI